MPPAIVGAVRNKSAVVHRYAPFNVINPDSLDASHKKTFNQGLLSIHVLGWEVPCYNRRPHFQNRSPSHKPALPFHAMLESLSQFNRDSPSCPPRSCARDSAATAGHAQCCVRRASRPIRSRQPEVRQLPTASYINRPLETVAQTSAIDKRGLACDNEITRA